MLDAESPQLLTPTQIARKSGWSLRAVQMWFEDGLPNRPVRTRGGMARGAAWEDVEAYLKKTGRGIKAAREKRDQRAEHDGDVGDRGAGAGGGVAAGGVLDFSASGDRSETQVAEEFERRLRQSLDQLMPVDPETGKVVLAIEHGNTGDADRIAGAIRKFSGELRLLAEHRQALQERSKEVVARAEVAAAWAKFGTGLVAELSALAPDLARDVGSAAAALVPPERADELRRVVAAKVSERTGTLRERVAAGLRNVG